MAILNYQARELTAKIVYYGPGLSGKTSSLQYIHSRISPKTKGKLMSLATETDRTLFFDFFPAEFGQVGGFKIKFNFFTVPGQVFYDATRRLVLKGADGVVFVADSQPDMMAQNHESLQNLKDNLKAHGIPWEAIPFVIQYNKRDVPGALPAEELRTALNPRAVPDFETIATSGAGVMEAMKAICSLVIEDANKKQKASARAGNQTVAPVRAASETAPLPPAAPAQEPLAEPPQEVKAGIAAPSAGIERTVRVPLRGPGTSSISLNLPLDLDAGEGVEAAEVSVQVRVQYVNGSGQTQVRELTAGPERRKGFWAWLLGWD